MNSKGNPSNHSKLMAGQHHLYEELKETKTGCLGARAAKLLITDCYSRGVVRVAVESTKLILDSQHNNPMHAESIKTAPDTKIEQAQPHEQKTDELAQRCRIARHGPSMGDEATGRRSVVAQKEASQALPPQTNEASLFTPT